MKKSVYSLVLMDNVVDAIDEMAYSLNTSRSNLINQILAEKVSMMTPEMRMRDIFSQIERLMDNSFQLTTQPSDTMISIKSPLKYKYKPTIRYSIELYRSFEGTVGRLRVNLRTQSKELIMLLQSFFQMWRGVENKLLSSAFLHGVAWHHADINFSRDFQSPLRRHLTDDEIANAIGGYINLLDASIKLYFANIDDMKTVIKKLEKNYADYLQKGVIIL